MKTSNKPITYKKTAPKLDAIMSEIERGFTPPFYETPTNEEIAAATDISETEVRRYIHTLVKLGRLMRSERGKVVPAPRIIHLTQEQANAPREWRFGQAKDEWEVLTRSIAQAAPTPEQTTGDQDGLNQRD